MTPALSCLLQRIHVLAAAHSCCQHGVRPCTHSLVVDMCSGLLVGVAWAAVAHNFMHPPCGLGNFLILLMGVGPVGDNWQQGRTVGSPAGTPKYGQNQGSA